jgi:hypothetical protein
MLEEIGFPMVKVISLPFCLYNSRVRCVANSGFSISSIRSEPTWASQSLNGSAYGDGID